MIKMIAVDVDDTLLRTDKTISDYTLDILCHCRENGIKVVIATARGHPEKVIPVEHFDGRILCNGAVIVVDGKTYRQTISHSEARPLLIACSQRGMRITTQYDDMHYSNFDVDKVWPEIKIWEFIDFINLEVDIEKINIADVSKDDAIFVEQNLTINMYLKVARDGLGMIMHKNATKSRSLAKLAKLLNIAPHEIIAFGDDLNDIDMLAYAGISVAMGNALDELKDVAYFVCLSNDNDGFARWLGEYIL